MLLPVKDDIGAELPNAKRSLPSLFAGCRGSSAVGALGLLSEERLLLAAFPFADPPAAEASQAFEGAVEEDALDPAGGRGLSLAVFGLGCRWPSF